MDHGESSCAHYGRRFEALKTTENEKNILIHELITKVAALEAALEGQSDRLEREKDVATMYQLRSKENLHQLQSIQHNIDRSAFVSVLIDGDAVNFVDELVKQGAEGGRQSLRLLKTAITDHLQERDIALLSSTEIVIKVYANLRGLARAYKEAGIISNIDDLEDFVRGFNQEDPYCDIVHAGTGSQCADEKLKAQFKLSVDNLHCRHIVFGASTDNGYARLLGPYCHGTKHTQSITILQGPPFARELADLVAYDESEMETKFVCLKASNVFREEKIPTRSFASPVVATSRAAPIVVRSPPMATPAPAVSTPAPPPIARSSGYASIAAATDTNGSGTSFNLVDRTKTPERKVFYNRHQQRVDPPLNYSRELLGEIKRQKNCNLYHILDQCYKGDSCEHRHGPRKTGRQLETLKYIARMMPCQTGLYCDDPDCIGGHRCPRDPCAQAQCWFASDMHGVDTQVIQTIKI